MAVFLGLGQGILVNAGLAQHLSQCILNHGRLHQIVLRNVQVSVVLQHTGKLDAGVIAPVKLVEVLPVKGQRNLLGPVASEVEENHTVAVGDSGHRLAATGHHKGRQILVDAAGFRAVSLNRLFGGGELPADALHMGAPAGFHHGPVCLIAVHGDLHPAAAGGDGIVAAVGIQLLQHILQHGHILQRGGGGHVTAVQQDVAVGLLHALGVRLTQQRDQMMDVGMDVAVAQQAEEMHGPAVFRIGDQILPGFGRVQCSVFNGLSDQLGALGINLAAAQRVVTDLAVAHILVRGQADGGAVSLQVSMRAGRQQVIQGGRFGNGHRIAAAAVTLADAVHDDQNNGFFHGIIPP